mmetsp:Transcript_33036/g.87328  ORF Transcript_33036/g.87328 Transcript_33036/m.87328 type:complete len:342 (+) Transcript_33036:9897-10922(+)
MDLAEVQAVGDRAQHLVLLVRRVDLLLNLRHLFQKRRCLCLRLAEFLHGVRSNVEFFEGLFEELLGHLDLICDLPLQRNDQTVTQAFELVLHDALQDHRADRKAVNLDSVCDLVHLLALRLERTEVQIPIFGVLHLVHHLLDALWQQPDDKPRGEGVLQLLYFLEQLVCLLENDCDSLLVPVRHGLVDVGGALQAFEHQWQGDERLDLLVVAGLQLFQRRFQPELFARKHEVCLHLRQMLIQALQTETVLHFHDLEDLVVPVSPPRSGVGVLVLAAACCDGYVHDLLDLSQLLLPLISLPEQADVGQLHHLGRDLLVPASQPAVDRPQALGAVLYVSRECL